MKSECGLVNDAFITEDDFRVVYDYYSKASDKSKICVQKPPAQRSKSNGDINNRLIINNFYHKQWMENILFCGNPISTTSFKNSKDDIEKNEFISEKPTAEVIPDGNWGWFIVLSSFFIQFIVIGFDGCSGILFLKFQDKYKKSAAITAWLGSLATALRLTLGPLASGLSNRFTERTVIMVSGVILALSMILTGLSPNVIYVFLSFGILGGIGRSFAYCPAIVMLGLYFKKKQGLATGIAASGCGVGRFALSLVVPLLFLYFNYVGAFIMMGGIALQVVVMGALMRPLATKTDATSVRIKADDMKNNNIVSPSVAVVIPTCDSTDNCNKQGGEKQNNQPEEKAKLFNFSLLKDVRFLGFCITMMLSSLAEQSAFVFLPAFAEEIGVLGQFSSEYTLAIASVFNTFAKIMAGFVFDCGIVRLYRVYLYNLLMFGLVIVSLFIPSVKTFYQLAIVCALYGLFTGSYTAQKSVIIVDILGRDKIKHSYGILMMFQGLGVFIGPPLSGLFKDINGRYDVAFYIGGFGILIGSMILFVNNVVHYINNRKKEIAMIENVPLPVVTISTLPVNKNLSYRYSA